MYYFALPALLKTLKALRLDDESHTFQYSVNLQTQSPVHNRYLVTMSE